MNEDHKANIRTLVETLRTTEVDQIKGYLNISKSGCEHVKVGMCCLGVACSIVPGLAQKRETGNCAKCGEEYEFITYDGVSGMLPEAASMFYDLPSSPGIQRAGDEFRTILAIIANDSYSYSFSEIADGFERRYLS